jgi:hypothetical protein
VPDAVIGGGCLGGQLKIFDDVIERNKTISS